MEWHNLKVRLLQDKKKKRFGGDYINYILSESYFQNGYEGVMELLKIDASLSSSNVEVERGFSDMNKIKTKLRNKLDAGRIQDLMSITLNGEEVKN